MIRINKWWEQFENAGSRKLVTIRHFSSVVGNDSKGYRKLMKSGSKGLAAFGVFQALCQLMGGLGVDARKVGETRNSDGSLLDLEDLSDLIRVNSKQIDDAISLLCEVNWIERLEPLINKESPNDLPSSPNDLPSSPTDLPSSANGEEGRGEERREGESLSQKWDACFLSEIWKMAPEPSRRRSSKKQVLAAWNATKDKPNEEDVISAFEAWTKCHDWQKEGGQFAPSLHLWFKNEKWESVPDDSKNNSNATTCL